MANTNPKPRKYPEIVRPAYTLTDAEKAYLIAWYNPRCKESYARRDKVKFNPDNLAYTKILTDLVKDLQNEFPNSNFDERKTVLCLIRLRKNKKLDAVDKAQQAKTQGRRKGK